MNEDKFKKLDDINKMLENVNTNVYTYLSNLDLETVTQKKVDDICVRLSDNINKKLETQRQIIIKSLHQGYVGASELISLLKPIVEADVKDLASVINVVKKIINIYTKPYEQAIEFVTVLTPKLQDLAVNIALLAYIPSKIPPIPNINFDKLQISMKPITVDDIIAGVNPK